MAQSEKAKEVAKKWRKANPEKCKESHRRYHRKRRVEDRAYQLKKRYNLSVDDYNKMLEKQNGKCFICNKIIKLYIDHNHKTGNVRGLLCQRCNTGLGQFDDNPLLLLNAIRYLEVN